MAPLLLLAAATLVVTSSAGEAADPVFPFSWDTLGGRLYSFCSNQSGALSQSAVAALSKSTLMIHGMEVGAMLTPVWQNSELKTSLAAKQLRAVAPGQLQLYTVQIDYARSVYASGAWFNNNSQCTLKKADGTQVLNNSTKPSVGHCDHKVDGPGYPYGACVVYGFDTSCGSEQWTTAITDACEEYNLDGVFIDGFQGCDPFGKGGGGCPRLLHDCDAKTATAWLAGLKTSLLALHKNFTTGKNAGKKKKIICNLTGGTFNCDTTTQQCICSASNSERWGGGDDGVKQLIEYGSDFPSKGVIVHVPHTQVGNAVYNSSMAGYLLGASDGDGYGIGFGYECGLGGWLKFKNDPNLEKPLGEPTGPATNTSNIWRRSFTSGVKVYMNSTPPAVGARLATCITWADGATTGRNNGCSQVKAQTVNLSR